MFLKKMFGGANGGPAGPSNPKSATSAQKTIDTIQQLTEHEESLEKRKSLLEKRIEAELDKARQFSKQQKKPQALQCMKKKKLLEQEVSNLDNMIMRVIEQRSMLESQRTTVEVISTMHNAAMQAKTNMKVMNVENVDKVIDEINDANDQMKQIHEAMGQSTADIDEDELLGELEELEATELDNELLEPAPVPISKPTTASQMPSVPAGKVPAKKAQEKTPEELELEALQAEMAL